MCNVHEATADIFITRDCPELGFWMFTPLTEVGFEMLWWIAYDNKACPRGGVWHGRSVALEEAGNSADYVFQSLLWTGVVMRFDTGETISIPEDVRESFRTALGENTPASADKPPKD
jgi:hypothetical protein